MWVLSPRALLLNPPTSTLLHSPPAFRTRNLSPVQTLTLSRKSPSLSRSSSLSSPSFQSPFHQHQQQQQQQQQQQPEEKDDEDDEHVIGDCIVFEEGIFEDPYLQPEPDPIAHRPPPKSRRFTKAIQPQDLVPDGWKEVVAEINMTKKERRRVSQAMEFGTGLERKRREALPVGRRNVEEYLQFREAKLAQLKSIILDKPKFAAGEKGKNDEDGLGESRDAKENGANTSRAAPKNPRWAVYGRSLEDISDFFNSEDYEPGRGAAATKGHRKLFTKEEKVLLNRRIPDLAAASSGKWLPLHSLAASGEFYLMDALLKHNVDINGVDKDGLTALHRAILSRKQAITNYLLRESANPFLCDNDGASLLHYAVQAASIPAIKVVLLYNLDINLQDNAGWTPLHVAVQTRRTDVVRLLLIKGADKMLKNNDGLTPLDICLYSGRDMRTYELIKLLKKLPKLAKKVDGKRNVAMLRLPNYPSKMPK